MSTEDRTEDRIVTAMAELMRAQGYAATGIKQLATAADAPVGSLYHHFRAGKTAIAAAALRRTGAAYIELLPLLLDPEPDLARGIETAFAAAAEDLEASGWINMCPVGTVAGEVVDAVPELAVVVREVFTMWVDTATGYLVGRGLTPVDARRLTHALLAGLEGGFVLARGLRSREPLRESGRALAVFAASLPRQPPPGRSADVASGSG